MGNRKLKAVCATALIVAMFGVCANVLADEENKDYYKIKFDPNGGSGAMYEQQMPVGEKTALNANEFENKATISYDTSGGVPMDPDVLEFPFLGWSSTSVVTEPATNMSYWTNVCLLNDKLLNDKPIVEVTHGDDGVDTVTVQSAGWTWEKVYSPAVYLEPQTNYKLSVKYFNDITLYHLTAGNPAENMKFTVMSEQNNDNLNDDQNKILGSFIYETAVPVPDDEGTPAPWHEGEILFTTGDDGIVYLSTNYGCLRDGVTYTIHYKDLKITKLDKKGNPVTDMLFFEDQAEVANIGESKDGVFVFKANWDMDQSITLPTPVKNCSVFKEWTDGENSYAAGDKISPKEDIELTAVWEEELVHTWGDWKLTKKATLDSEGEETRTCSVCNATETRKTAKAQVSLTLDKSSMNIICGEKGSLKATVTETSEKVSWKSSDTKIATVDANGKITTKMAGTVTITASVAGKKATCTVTVLYKDVVKTSDFWYAPTNYLTKNGIVKGYDNQTLFKPTNECSRAQMVTFLYRLAGQPTPKKTTTDFKDIKTTDYFYKPVLWAVENGITTGVSKEKFNPQGICTRAQTVTFLWRMAGKPAPKTKTSKFTDIDSKDYFYKATLWASEMKIVAGYDDNTFRPQGNCLRRQMVTFLYKYDKYVNGKG